MAGSGIMLDFESNFIQIVDGKSAPTEQTRHGINPATKQPLPPVPVATEKILNDAVTSGRTAFATWSQIPYEERRKAVRAYADAIEGHSAKFIQLLTREQGRPVRLHHLDYSHFHLQLTKAKSKGRRHKLHSRFTARQNGFVD
jgi:acyl-CoA reductase-like NAD-dependent aldehyde dehydrogenase